MERIIGLPNIRCLILGDNQKEMAVFKPEIYKETKKSSIPSFLAKYMPPPTVTIQTGH
jgi:hypothetical protein